MELETRVKLAIYTHFSETGRRPLPEEVASRAGLGVAEILEAYPRLRAQRRLATTWYATRLQPEARRPPPEEMRSIFAGLGLSGDFWDPQSDTFG